MGKVEAMISLTYGEVPSDLAIDGPYRMELNRTDFDTVQDIVNQGIDSHLEAVCTSQKENIIWILDAASMRCFLRRCIESDNDNASDLASRIMSTLDYEWI